MGKRKRLSKEARKELQKIEALAKFLNKRDIYAAKKYKFLKDWSKNIGKYLLYEGKPCTIISLAVPDLDAISGVGMFFDMVDFELTLQPVGSAKKFVFFIDQEVLETIKIIDKDKFTEALFT